MEIKDILVKKRKEKGLTQFELAELLCISRGAYAKYETGRNTPPTEIVLKLAEFYDCSTDYILGRYKA